jgi:hypothetical protein
MTTRAHVLAQIAATLAVGQRAEHHMTADEAERFVENADLLLTTAERHDLAREGDSGAAHQQAMERFPGRG